METYASMPEAGWRRCVLQESAVAASPMSDSKGGNESKRIVSPAKAGAQGNPHCLINGLPSAAGILRGISSLAPGSRFRGKDDGNGNPLERVGQPFRDDGRSLCHPLTLVMVRSARRARLDPQNAAAANQRHAPAAGSSPPEASASSCLLYTSPS